MSDPLANQWWVINGAELHAALHRAHGGGDPELVYVEFYANSNTERSCSTCGGTGRVWIEDPWWSGANGYEPCDDCSQRKDNE